MDTALHVALLVLVPPLLLGVIARVKAIAAGRRGPPILQPYHDVLRLLRKGAVYSRTTSWVFPAGPIVGLAATFTAGLVVPLSSMSAPLGFEGDVILFAYLLGLSRFATMAAALDTGSSFEGMGASREATFGALAEPALFLCLAILCLPGQTLSFQGVFTALPWASWGASHPELAVVAAVLLVVLLAECSRIPVDDPNTHLELTMIHEVMVLDHGGPDFAFVQLGASCKLFVLGALLCHVLLPIRGGLEGAGMLLAGEIGVAVLVGILESTMARLRLVRVPQFLIGATVLAAIGVAVVFYRGPS